MNKKPTHTNLRRIPLSGTLRLLWGIVVVSLLTAAAYGQVDQGRIGGVVKDPSGALIPGATLIVKNVNTGEEKKTVTGDNGEYVVTALRPSTYSVKASLPGFADSESSSIQVVVGQKLTLDFTLRPANLAQTVDVTTDIAEATVDTSSASIGVNVVQREVEGLPLNGRQVSQLYLQAPGSVNSGSGTFGDIRFSGRATEQNIIRFDGIEGTAIIDANPGVLNGEVSAPFRLQSSLENVQEFRIESSNYPAEFGTGTGGQISVVTKSGGNDFHGSVFEYLRNDALDAANFFDNVIGKKAPLRLNQYGGSVGGPIVRNKTFFFFSFEGYKLRAGINTTEAVPGDQARICAPGPGGANCTESGGQPSRTLALLAAFRDPKAQIVSTGTGTNLFDVAQLQANAVLDERALALRIDHQFSPMQKLYFRFFRDDGNIDQPEGVTGRRVVFVDNPQNGVVGFQSTLSPTLLNEVKFGYNGVFSRTNGVAPTVNGIDLSKLTINISGNTANFSIPGQGTSAGTANPGGLVRANSATNGRGQPYTVYSLTFADNLSWSRNKHNYKFGFEFRPSRLYTDRQGGTTYVFNNITDFLQNRPASIQYLGDVSDPSPFNNGATGMREAKLEYYIGFAQDEWRIRPNLTLNYGLRYEYYTPMREARNLDVLFNPQTGLLDPPTRAFTDNKHAFGPRVGMTWSPNANATGGLGRTVLRGGFGIFYGPGQVEDQIQPIESDRISSTVSNGAFDPDLATFISGVQANFAANPNNRSFQPRAYAPLYKIPETIYSYTASVQQELPYKMVATVAYVGSQGRNLFLRGLSNTFRPGAATILDGTAIPTNAGIVNRTNAGGQVIGITTVRTFSIVSGTSVQNPYAEIDTKTTGGSDTYNSMQLMLSRRYSNGLTLNSQYTLARSFGNTSGSNEARTAAQPLGGTPRADGDVNNYEADRGFNNFDVRHNFNVSAIYNLPFGAGKRYNLGSVGNAILGNWEIGGIANARSGVPIDVTVTRPDTVLQCVAAGGCTVNSSATTTTLVPQGFTVAQPSGISGSQPLPVGFEAVANAPGGGSSRQTRRPDLIAGVDPYQDADRNFLNPAAFSIPLAGTYGNLGRNALKGPTFKQFDLILNRRFPFGEGRNLEFRTEIFNILNHPNFAVPASTLASALPGMTFNTTAGAWVLGSGTQPGQAFTQSAAGSTFGLLRQTVEKTVGLGTNRQIQFALRVNF
jgi:Carboxypeptidase regulatory-like domain